jgi:hypothetical protein
MPVERAVMNRLQLELPIISPTLLNRHLNISGQDHNPILSLCPLNRGRVIVSALLSNGHIGYVPRTTLRQAQRDFFRKIPKKNAPSGTRTPDPLIKSQLLYQLS